MIFSTTSAEVIDLQLPKHPLYAFSKQLLYAIGGFFLAYCGWKYGYKRFISLSPWLLWLGIGMLLAVLIPGIGKTVNGARRWLAIGPFSLQPSEFFKYIVPAYFIYTFQNSVKEDPGWKSLLRLLLPPLCGVALILVEPNNGTAAVVGLTLLLMLWLAQIPLRYWGLPLLIGMILACGIASRLPYVTGRLSAYFNPEKDLKGKGHQPHQAKIAAGSGGFWGKGAGKGWQKLSYLPEAQNDYIAAIYAEEFGFIGIFLLILAYLCMTFGAFQMALHINEPNGILLAMAISFLLAFQAFLNLGVVSGLLPSTGLNLPLFSQGGSSLMAHMMGLGLLCSLDSKVL